jgi:glycosyltransferase involved in cell wall biosynthesis
MGQAFPEILKRAAARQLYRLLRISAPLLRPFYRHVGLESRARAVTALVRIGWNGAEIAPPALKQSEIVTPVPVELGEIAQVNRATYGLPEDATLFLFFFDPSSFVERKNPLAVVEAFHRAFGARGDPGVGLVIKTLDAGPHAGALKKLKSAVGGDDRIHLIEKTMSRPEVNGLIAATDAFVSLHRSEGFGFGLAEAMLLAKPAIGTDYSGNTDFLTEATGYPVPYELVPVGAGEYPDHAGQVWAEPDVAAAARER